MSIDPFNNIRKMQEQIRGSLSSIIKQQKMMLACLKILK